MKWALQKNCLALPYNVNLQCSSPFPYAGIIRVPLCQNQIWPPTLSLCSVPCPPSRLSPLATHRCAPEPSGPVQTPLWFTARGRSQAQPDLDPTVVNYTLSFHFPTSLSLLHNTFHLLTKSIALCICLLCTLWSTLNVSIILTVNLYQYQNENLPKYNHLNPGT